MTANARQLCDEGYASLEAGRYDEARALLERARAMSPDDPLVHFRLALLLVDTGNPEAAIAALERSLALDPGNARAHNNRGAALEMLGRVAEAEQAFRRALDLAGDLAQPYVNLGHLLEKQGNVAEAIALYELAISRGLDPPRFRHHLAAISGKPADRASDEWVRATFDDFAPNFDARLHALGYDAPRRLAAMLGGRVAAPADILDLGCGTGQCGLALAAMKRRLTGVDLSPKMLTLARAHGIYDELHTAEVGSWLAAAEDAHYDIAIAADVFIYIGALENVFGDVSRVLRGGGWFAFSTEEAAETDHVLRPSGRFAQSRAYIARLARAAFTIVAAEAVAIRVESGMPIAGRLYLLRKV